MAIRNGGLPDVSFETLDGALGRKTVGTEESVTCFLFDISKQKDLFSKGYGKENIKNIKEGDVIGLYSVEDLEEFGIIPFTEPEESQAVEDVNFMYGIPHYHISEYFRVSKGESRGAGELYIMFADCSKDWSAINVLQNSTGGRAYQIGVYTEQALFDSEGAEDGTYALRLTEALEDKAKELNDEHAPAVIVLSASPTLNDVEGDERLKIDLDKMPNMLQPKRSRISVVIGQANHSSVKAMQLANPNSTPVGVLGASLGLLSSAKVSDSIGWVKMFNIFGSKFQRVELGFGDLTKEDGEFVSTNQLESFNKRKLNKISEKGFMFPIKYAGEPNGVYFNFDQTLSNGDFYSLSNNRTIFKSERLTRKALLPFLNGSVTVSLTDGTLTAASISDYNEAINRGLEEMKTNREISGSKVYIDPKQKILENDTLFVEYSIVPQGKSRLIKVKQGYDVNTK